MKRARGSSRAQARDAPWVISAVNAMFMGTYTNKVDAKGRVSVPADFRAVLAAEGFEGIKCFRSFAAPCLEAAGPAYFTQLKGYIDALDPYDDMRDVFEWSIFGGSKRFFFDGDGRITLDADFMKHADIGDAVIFVGRGDKFEIWNPEQLEARLRDAHRRAYENRGLLSHRRTEGSER